MVGRPTWDELWSGMAYQVSRRGTCSRAKVGAILVSSNNVLLGMGYNGAPRGLGHCSHDGSETRCELSVHAEVNAIASAARKGHAVEGATCYITHSPCRPCAGVFVNAGVKAVVYNIRYRSDEGLEVCNQAQIIVRRH